MQVLRGKQLQARHFCAFNERVYKVSIEAPESWSHTVRCSPCQHQPYVVTRSSWTPCLNKQLNTIKTFTCIYCVIHRQYYCRRKKETYSEAVLVVSWSGPPVSWRDQRSITSRTSSDNDEIIRSLLSWILQLCYIITKSAIFSCTSASASQISCICIRNL